VVAIDGHEISDHEWLSAAEVLLRRDAGAMELAPPTWVTLFTLANHASVDDLLDAFRSGSPEHFFTEPLEVEGGTVALWHGDAAYGGGDLHGPGPRHRLWMVDGGWHYERTV
jgi:hypothetical protein